MNFHFTVHFHLIFHSKKLWEPRQQWARGQSVFLAIVQIERFDSIPSLFGSLSKCDTVYQETMIFANTFQKFFIFF